jgi:hypothetical protein
MLVTWLSGQFPGIRVLTDLPADLEKRTPVIAVSRFGGAGTVVGFDEANIDVEIWHTSLANADRLAGMVAEQLLLNGPGSVVNDAVITRVACTSGPSSRPTANPLLQRIGASYRVAVHSH